MIKNNVFLCLNLDAALVLLKTRDASQQNENKVQGQEMRLKKKNLFNDF